MVVDAAGQRLEERAPGGRVRLAALGRGREAGIDEGTRRLEASDALAHGDLEGARGVV